MENRTSLWHFPQFSLNLMKNAKKPSNLMENVFFAALIWLV
jgi:hypothetical protein